MEPVTPEAIRKLRTKMVECKSGRAYEIQKPGILPLIRMMKIFGLEIPVGGTAEDIQKLVDDTIKSKKLTTGELAQVVEILVPACSKNPKIALEPTKEVLGINEIPEKDTFDLLDAMMDFAGFGEQAAEMRNTFQQ